MSIHFAFLISFVYISLISINNRIIFVLNKSLEDAVWMQWSVHYSLYTVCQIPNGDCRWMNQQKEWREEKNRHRTSKLPLIPYRFIRLKMRPFIWVSHSGCMWVWVCFAQFVHVDFVQTKESRRIEYTHSKQIYQIDQMLHDRIELNPPKSI